MLDAVLKPPPPKNEPVLTYAPGTPERARLKAELSRMSGETIELPMFVGGEEVRTGKLVEVRAPHRRELLLARAHAGGAAEAEAAIRAARAARPGWAAMPLASRAAIFLRAAELLATRDRALLCAATMLGQSKTAYQAEIDAACELADFLRFNAHYAFRIAEEQPESPAGVWNTMEPRPLEGFVYAVSPFNFTAIAGNLPACPALMGNTVVWKPSDSALYSAHFVMRLFREAGLPDGVINLVMGDPAEITRVCVESPELAGVHFTGSTAVFQNIWKRVGENIGRYRTYPRLVGETGGKDFVFAHPSADLESLAVALVRGAYEYQGQKCSAASRAYVPRSLWPALRGRLEALLAEVRVGDVADFRNFMGAVIHEHSFKKLEAAIGRAKAEGAELVAGGRCRGEAGYFVDPTLFRVEDPGHFLMQTEFFGPILAVFPYPDAELDRALSLCESTSPYGLTGAIFSRDRAFVERAKAELRFAAGNLYINDKPTGAVVGQQPFGGGRASGTNDKAGSLLNLHRWTSPRVVKETFVPSLEVGYPFMREA